MMFSRKVFCGATSPRRPPGIPAAAAAAARYCRADAAAASCSPRRTHLHTIISTTYRFVRTRAYKLYK